MAGISCCISKAESIVGMVLVQEDDSMQEHVIYYLSRGLIGPELNYSHIKKLSLVVFTLSRDCDITFYYEKPL
jgi:hypothetical protein